MYKYNIFAIFVRRKKEMQNFIKTIKIWTLYKKYSRFINFCKIVIFLCNMSSFSFTFFLRRSENVEFYMK